MALSDMIGLVAILRNRGVNPSICAAIQEYAAILCSRLRAVHIQNRLGLRQHHIHMAPVRPCHGGSASRAAAIVVVTLNGRAAPFYQCANERELGRTVNRTPSRFIGSSITLYRQRQQP